MEQKIIEIIRDNCCMEDEDAIIKQEQTLFSDLGMDFLDLIELSMRLEENFGVEVFDDDADQWTTVQDVMARL